MPGDWPDEWLLKIRSKAAHDARMRDARGERESFTTDTAYLWLVLALQLVEEDELVRLRHQVLTIEAEIARVYVDGIKRMLELVQKREAAQRRVAELEKGR